VIKEGIAVWALRPGLASERETLLLRRAVDPFRGQWFAVEGKLDPGEGVVTAALRELREETALEPVKLFRQRAQPWLVPSAGYVARVHVFVALVARVEPVLNGEHSAYRWCAPLQARRLLPDGAHQECFREIERDFIREIALDALAVSDPTEPNR